MRRLLDRFDRARKVVRGELQRERTIRVVSHVVLDEVQRALAIQEAHRDDVVLRGMRLWGGWLSGTIVRTPQYHEALFPNNMDVIEHLKRFSFREELGDVRWERAQEQ